MYSVYNIPNIILPFIGGIVLTKFGNNIVFIVVGVFLLIGQLLFALGCSVRDINVMLCGRMFFGFGGEIINIAQNCIMIKWFKKAELSFPFGIAITVSRLGSVLNDVASPRISTKADDPSAALWVGGLIVAFSLICSIILIALDKYVDRLDNHLDTSVYEEEVLNLKSMFQFRYILWLLIIVCVTLYSGFLPFNNIASGYLTKTHFSSLTKKEAENLAGSYMAIPFVISAIFVPIFGLIIDNIGKRAYFITTSSIFGIISFLSFSILPPIFSMILLGFTYSLFAAVLWPVISLVTNKNLVGLAFGVATSLQNLGMAVAPIIVAALLTNFKNYELVLTFFICLNTISFILSILIIFEDKKLNGIINTNVFKEEKSNQCKDKNKEDESIKLMSANESDK